jgi:hypothetical protein
MSAPMMISEQSELISAMSSLNMHDERKPYRGLFLTDEIDDIKKAYQELSSAFDLLKNKKEVSSDEYCEKCQNAINFLNQTENGVKHSEIHFDVAHSIQHIKAAILINSNRTKDI